MSVSTVHAVYFSGTGTTEKTVRRIARRLADKLGAAYAEYSYTLPDARKRELTVPAGDLAVVGCPTYAGRVPNLLMPYLRDMVHGAGALAVPVALFGNRNYDDALMELSQLLTADGFTCVAGAAFVGEHSFSCTLGAGRPNDADMAEMDAFADLIAARLAAGDTAPVTVGGCDPIRPYYTPRDRHGNPINILKVKPKTDMTKCGNCGWCAAHCPMGSIDPDDPSQVPGTCIKCCACVKGCPTGAKYYDDPGYLYHKSEHRDFEILLDTRQQHLHQRRAGQDRRIAHRRRPHQESRPRPYLSPDAARVVVAGAGRDDGGMRHPAGTHGRDRAERPDYRRHGHDPRHGRHGYRAFRTHALGGGGRAQALDRKPGIEARSHHPIRPQLRVHDARI